MKLQTAEGRMSPAAAVALAVIGFVFLVLNFQGCLLRPPWSHGWSDHGLIFSPFGAFYGLLGIWGLIQIGLAIWVGVDAHRRGSNGFLWGLLVFFTPVVGLIVYLILAPSLAQRNGLSPPQARAASAVCPACNRPVELGFKICPYCRASLRCPQCDEPIRDGWKVCPYCATPLAEPTGSEPAG